MYNETQLAAIKLFGDKTLSEGCIVLQYHMDEYYDDEGNTCGSNDTHILGKIDSDGNINMFFGDKIYTYDYGKIIEHTDLTEYDDFFIVYPTLWSKTLKVDKKDTEILGHEPHLFPDVARVAMERGLHIGINTTKEYLYVGTYELGVSNPGIPYNPTLPLLSQPHLSEIVNLFSK